MAQKNNPDQLKNRFQGIEMSLDDSELKYKLSADSIQQISKVKNQDFPILFIYTGLALRASRIIFSSFGKMGKGIWVYVLGPVVREIYKTLTFSFKKMREIKNEKEIAFEGYLDKVENELTSAKETAKKIEFKRSVGLESYEKELNFIFKDVKNSAQLICEKNEFEKVNLSLEFDLSLYETMALKLSNTKMISNVTSLTINSVVEEKLVVNTIEFDLKVAGEKWAKIFSTYIASEVLNKIEGYNGKVENTHQFNPIKKSEKFILVFTHQRLDQFVDQTREESQKKKTYNHPQLDL